MTIALLRSFAAACGPIATRGSAAMEFAFVAPVFFALMLGIMEIGVMTFAQFALQNARDPERRD